MVEAMAITHVRPNLDMFPHPTELRPWTINALSVTAPMRLIDKTMAEGTRPPPYAILFLIVDQFDVAQMARRIARPPDAVRVGRVELDAPCIRFDDRQRELGPGFRR